VADYVLRALWVLLDQQTGWFVINLASPNWTHLSPCALPSLFHCTRFVTTSRAVRCFSVALEVLRRWPKCKFAPSARVSPQWRLARARRCRSGNDSSTCAGVEGGGRSGSTAFLPADGSSSTVLVVFSSCLFLLFLFFLFLRFLVILCSFLAAAVTILFLLPLHLVPRFYPHSDVPHYTTPPLRSALPSHESDSIPHSPPS